MKKIVINNDNRRFNISSIVVGYLEENKEEVLEFEIPEKYAEYGKKACFSANGQTFAKNFDDVISNKLTITRDISQFKELDMTIEFFKIENEDKVVARTSILHILIDNAIICDDDVKPDEPKIIILDNLIDEVTKLDVLVTKNEKKREEYYQEIQKKVDNGDFNGATFTPSVDVNGNINWTNDKGLTNPTTQNIKGPKGPKGDTYNLTEQDKKDISSITVESSESAFNQYYNGKLQDFNNNAISKTNDYNSNATTKTNEYNNNAISKVNEYNTNATNKIAEYDLHSQELNNKIVSTRNELERVKNDVLETGTDTDTFIHLEDSAMAEYQELSIDGVCEQETTTGKNLLDYVSNLITSANGLTNVINEDGSITTTGKPTSNYSTIIKSINITDILEDGQKYTISQNVPANLFVQVNMRKLDGTLKYLNSNRGSSSFIVDKSIYSSYTLVIQTTSMETWGDSPLTITNKYMLCKGTDTADTSFEPYTGGQPSPSPEFPQEIKTITGSLKLTSCDNGLFDGELRQGSWNSITNSDRCFSKNNIYVEAGDYLLITDLDINNYRYGILVSDNSFPTQVKNFSYDSGWKRANKFEFNLTKAGNLGINVSLINNANINPSTFANVKWLLINLDLVSIIEAKLPEGEFIGKLDDTYKDTLNVVYKEDGQYHLNLYKRVYKNNSYNGESYNYYISTTARKDGNIECGELQTGQVAYHDGDETIVDLGICDMPITYNGVTNLFTDSDLMPTINAKYYRNFITTVRNLQVNEKALKQELIDINNRLSALETAQTSVVSESEVVE